MVIEERLTKVFRKVFQNDSIRLSHEMTSENIPGWDSLTHIDLIVAVEKEFGIRFTTREVSGLQRVGELLALIEKKSKTEPDPKQSQSSQESTPAAKL